MPIIKELVYSLDEIDEIRRLNNEDLLDCLLSRSMKVSSHWIFICDATSAHIQIGDKDYVVPRLSLVIHLGLDYDDKSWTANHRCLQKHCWNPAHLYKGTLSSNQYDSIKDGTHFQASKTHCIEGHPLSGDNLYIRKDGKGRECRACRRLALKEFRALTL